MKVKRKQTVLFLLPNDVLGGAELYLKNMASYFLKSDYKVVVVFFKRRTTAEWSDLEIKGAQLIFSRYSKERWAFFYLLKTIYRLSRLNHIVYVFSSHTHANALLGVFRKFYILKTRYLVVRESTLIFERFKGARLLRFRLYYQIGYSATDLIICQTSVMLNQLLDNISKAKNWNVVVMPNAISIDDINEKSTITVSPLPESFGDFIVAAGRLIELKGFDILIESFSKISRNSRLNLVILGRGPELENLKLLTNRYLLSDRIFFLGHVNNPIPYFKSAKVCVVSSLIEGFPNVLLQMLSQNTKVVSTNCAGDLEDIPGLIICNPGDSEALERSILQAINATQNNESIRHSIDTFLRGRSVDSFCERLFQTLERVS